MWGKKSAPEQEAAPVPIQIPVPVSAQILEEEVVIIRLVSVMPLEWALFLSQQIIILVPI